MWKIIGTVTDQTTWWSVVNNTPKFPGSLRTFGMNASWQKKQGSEPWNWTTWCINQCGWKHCWWSHWFYVGPYLKSKQASHGYYKPDIMHLIGLAASAMSDLSRIWCQMRLTLTSKLRVYQCCLSVHGKVNMSTRLWHLDHSIGWRKYIRFWHLDHSIGWRKYIRFWDLDRSAGWRKYIRFWDQDHSAGWCKFIRLWDQDHFAGFPNQLEAFHVRCQRRIIDLERHNFVSNEKERTRTRLVPLNEAIQKQRVCLFR